MRRIDARGMRCPWPAIRLARALRDFPGETVEILADDPKAEHELRQLADSRGAGFVIVAEQENRIFRIETLN